MFRHYRQTHTNGHSTIFDGWLKDGTMGHTHTIGKQRIHVAAMCAFNDEKSLVRHRPLSLRSRGTDDKHTILPLNTHNSRPFHIKLSHSSFVDIVFSLSLDITLSICGAPVKTASGYHLFRERNLDPPP